jgi:hypothetical protein
LIWPGTAGIRAKKPGGTRGDHSTRDRYRPILKRKKDSWDDSTRLPEVTGSHESPSTAVIPETVTLPPIFEKSLLDSHSIGLIIGLHREILIKSHFSLAYPLNVI